MIHPQAVIDPGAKIGPGVSIGPFSIIGDDVEIGDGTWVGPHVVINGPTRIGKDNRIYQFSSLGDAPQHIRYQGEPTLLEIGDHNVIREYCTFNRGTAFGQGITRIGSNNFIMSYCHVAHDCIVGDHTILSNLANLAGHVEVGDYAYFGGASGVHQFCRIGAYCMIGAHTAVFKDVPPYVIAAGFRGEPYGINVTGLRRHDFTEETVQALKSAYKLVYRSGLKLDDALVQLEVSAAEHTDVARFVSFIKTSERGIIRR